MSRLSFTISLPVPLLFASSLMAAYFAAPASAVRPSPGVEVPRPAVTVSGASIPGALPIRLIPWPDTSGGVPAPIEGAEVIESSTEPPGHPLRGLLRRAPLPTGSATAVSGGAAVAPG